MSKTKVINLELEINRRILFISDIHGSPDLLRAALAKADFTNKDYLFILGDVIEKGLRSLETLQLVMKLCKKDNVFMILGNCDEMLNKMKIGNNNVSMKRYVLTVPHTIFKEMAEKLDIQVNENMNFEDYRYRILTEFKDEFEFIESLSHVIILNDQIVLVHAGFDDIDNIPKNSWDIMKYDYFIHNSDVQKKLMIVGHCPSVNYNNTYIWCNPIRSFAKNIITIDGGNNVINRGGQLNVLIVDRLDEINISYINVDNLKKVKVIQDIFYEPRRSYSVTFNDSKVEMIKEIDDFYLVRHLSTGNYVYAVKIDERKVGEVFNVCDATNYFIPLQKGEKVSLVLKAKPYSIIKNNGIIGLVETADLLNNMAKYNYVITEKFNGYTVLDFYRFFKLSKVKLGTIRQSSTVNNKLVYEKYRLKTNDVLSFSLDEDLDVKPFKKKLTIVYEDDNFLIIDKPANIIVHSDGVNTEKTLVNAVKYYYESKREDTLVRYCHRLDFETTGLIIFVKDPLTNSYMNELISHHAVKRDYLAIVSGKLEGSGVVDKKIGKDRHHNSRRRVGNTGLDAITKYTVLKSLKKCSLVKLELTTGRTHQIRVHMKYLGHPLVGDELYGGNLTISKKLCLLSYHLEFANPFSNKIINLTLPITNDMQRIVDKG